MAFIFRKVANMLCSMIVRCLHVLSLAAVALAVPAHLASAQWSAVEDLAAGQHDARDAFEETPCPIQLPPNAGDVVCGLVTVPESYDGSRRTIRIAVLVAKARAPSGQPPVMFLMGGPGYSAIDDAPDYLTSDIGVGAVRATRDLILIDQRGIGHSEPALTCPEIHGLDNDASRETRDGAIRACHRRLRAEGVNLAAFRTDFNSLDLNRVRSALGYRTVTLYGGSYGAKLGLQRLRGSPAWLESAVLSGSLDPLVNVYADSPRGFQRSLEALDRACSADATCLATYGHVRANVDMITAALAAAPREVTFIDLQTEQPATLLITVELLAQALGELLSIGELLPLLPVALKEASDGSYELLVSLGYLLYGPIDRSDGMRLSVLCSEEIAYSSPAEFRAAARGADRIVSEFFVPAQLDYFQQCKQWPVPRSTPLFQLPVVSRTPTLLISGRFDPKTPPRYADGIARFLTNDRHVVLEHGSHSSDEECETELVMQFLADRGTSLDVTCAERALSFAYRGPAPAAGTRRVLSNALTDGDPVAALLVSLKPRFADYARRR